MWLSTYQFAGDPDALSAGHERLMSIVPVDDVILNVSPRTPDGISVHDVCPSRAELEALDCPADLASAGLPAPTNRPIGEIGRMVGTPLDQA